MTTKDELTAGMPELPPELEGARLVAAACFSFALRRVRAGKPPGYTLAIQHAGGGLEVHRLWLPSQIIPIAEPHAPHAFIAFLWTLPGARAELFVQGPAGAAREMQADVIVGDSFGAWSSNPTRRLGSVAPHLN